MATLPDIGEKATNGSNAIPEAGSSWPSWPRASECDDEYTTSTRFCYVTAASQKDLFTERDLRFTPPTSSRLQVVQGYLAVKKTLPPLGPP